MASIPGNLEDRLLSHRLRGFAKAESSLRGLRAALRSRFKYFEVDTRHTADGEMLVYHDALLDTQTQAHGLVRDYSIKTRGRVKFAAGDGDSVATLQEFLEVFASSTGNSLLQLDIKDFGMEEHYVELIERFALQDRVIVISWVPEVLQRIHELAPSLQLGFSYVSLYGLSWAAAVPLAKPIFASQLPWTALSLIGRLVRSPGIRQLDRVLCFVNDYNRPWSELAHSPYAQGYFHVHLIDHIPGGELGEMIQRTGGYIGTDVRMASRAFVAEAHRRRLRVYVFSIDSRRKLIRSLRTIGPDIVFTNRADLLV